MKRLIYVAFGLMASLPAWGEEPPPGLLPQSETIALPQMSETTVSPTEQAPAVALPAAPETDKAGATDAPFRERPYRIWPIYYHRQFTPEHERTIYGPFWLTEHDRDTTLNYPLWPFTGITRTQGELEEIDLIWPFAKYERKDRRTTFDLLWPITGFTHGDAPEREESSLFLLRPVLGYYLETDRAPGDGAVTGKQSGYFPFYYNSENSSETFRYVFPSFLSGTEPHKGTSFHALLPLYLHFGEPGGSTLFVLPTFLRTKNSEGQLFSLLPFYHAVEDKQGSALFVFPSFFHKAADNGASLTGLMPLYLAGQAETGQSFRYVFPTWFERHKENYDSTWFLPFYTASDDATGGKMVRNRTLLWPLYYHRNDEGAGIDTTSVLLSLFYRRTNTSASERYTTLLWPLVSFGESPQYRLVRVWPYAYEQQIEDNFRAHYFLWPLIGFGSGDRESTARVLPLFYRHSNPERSFTMLLPLYLQQRTPERRFSLLLPLYANYTAADHEWTAVPPLVWGESGERRFSLFFPVWYRGVHRDDTENLLLNTWWSRKGERSSLAFFPLYYRSSAPGGSQTQLLNIWWEREQERSSYAFFPLYFRYDTPTDAGNLVLNTWWNGGERLERFVFFPLAWYHSPTPEEQDFTFIPLFSYDHKGDESSTFSLFWRLYYQRHDRDGSMSAFLWWLYRTEERPNYRRLMCWPFIDYERNTGTTDEVFTSILLRFMTYERNGKRTRFKLFGLTLYNS